MSPVMWRDSRLLVIRRGAVFPDPPETGTIVKIGLNSRTVLGRKPP